VVRLPNRENMHKRGFASMNAEQKREIARKGGKTAHALGVAHTWTSEQARAAGKKGGETSRHGREVRPTFRLDVARRGFLRVCWREYLLLLRVPEESCDHLLNQIRAEEPFSQATIALCQPAQGSPTICIRFWCRASPRIGEPGTTFTYEELCTWLKNVEASWPILLSQLVML